jgi:hypothetical protein
MQSWFCSYSRFLLVKKLNEQLVAPFQRFLPLVGTQELLGLSSG